VTEIKSPPGEAFARMLYPKVKSSPIGNWLTWMDSAEMEGVRPLKQVTHVPTPNEDLKLF
jgi:hypothetical protein